VAVVGRWMMRVGLVAWLLTVYCTFWIRAWHPMTYTMRAEQSASAKRYGEAIEIFSRALRRDPDYVPARLGLSYTLAQAGRLEEARRQAELAVQRHPDDVEAQMQLGSVLDLEGHYPEAIEHFQKAITLGPDHPGAYHQLALCLSKVQKRKEAIAACREGLRIYPFNFNLLNNLAWALATNPDAALRNGAEAVLLAERSCQLTSYEKPTLIGTLAAAYAEAGRFDEAVKAGEKAQRLALAAGEKEVAERNEELLKLYRAGRPYHETPQ